MPPWTMTKTTTIRLAVCVLATAAGGLAYADAPHRATVTFVQAPPNAARNPPVKRPPTVHVSRLDAATLADAKQQAAVRFRRTVSLSPVGLPSPLTLDQLAWQGTSGAVSGSMQVWSGQSVGVCAAPSCYSYVTGIWMTTGTSTLDLNYAGLTVGSVYLLDCGVANLESAQVWMMTTETASTTIPTTPSSDHLLVSWVAAMDSAWMTVTGKSKNDPAYYGWGWTVDSCTIHQVD